MKQYITSILLFSLAISALYSNNRYSLSFNPLVATFPQPISETQKLYQDKDGYIWVATINGLYQYDGYQLKDFKANNNSPNLLSNNNIHSVIEDNDYKLWIGTSNGLNVMDKKYGTISKANTHVFDNNSISSLALTDEGQLLVGTDDGVYCYDSNTKEFLLAEWKTSTCSLPRTSVQSLLKDSEGCIWVGTWSRGLYRYEPKSKELFQYDVDKRNSAHTLFEDSRGRLWIGTWGSGLYMLENKNKKENAKWTHFDKDGSSTGLADDIVYSISEDINTQSIWVGMRSGLGVISEITAGRFSTINYKAGSSNDIPYNEVNSIMRDRSGMMWLGTLGGGVYTVNTKKGIFNLNSLLSVKAELSSNSVRSLFVDDENIVWMGIGSYGLVSYNRNDQKTVYYSKKEGAPHQITSTVNCILQSSQNKKLYFGTYREGLFVYDKKDNTMRNFNPKNSELNDYCVQAFKEDKDGNIWIGSKLGINCIMTDGSMKSMRNMIADNENTANYFYQTIEIDDEGCMWLGSDNNGIVKIINPFQMERPRCKSYNIEKQTLASNNVQCIFKDSRGRIWTGSESGGLNVYDKIKDCFVQVNDRFNITSDAIYSIEEDEKEALWLGTSMGLLKLTPADNLGSAKVRLYTEEYGLQGSQFIRNASFKTSSGEMFFGGHNGYNSFYPDDIVETNITSPLVITDIKIHNRSLDNYDKSIRDKISILLPNFTKEIRLADRENNFSFDFTSLNYINPSKIKYAYMLEGFDPDWQYTDPSRRFAYYNNLPSGNYYFKLKSIDETGVWQERDIKIKVTILPPPWATWWAYLSYFIIFCLIGYFIQRNVRNRIRLNEQLRMKELEQAKLEEVNHTKLQFFTNITHELLTPLTITSAALDDLKIVSPQNTEHYGVMESNINRLIRLLQQILEFRKAETGNLKLKVSKGDLALFVKRGVESFKPLMKKKKIHFSIICNPEIIPAYFDTDKVDKILYNLLSNASKYNEENGFVQVNLSYGKTTDEVTLSVQDNGAGISKEKQVDLFKRFYEGDYRKFKTIGTGIGLSLTKDLVTLHNGEISVDSEIGKGTCFTISIPIDKSFYTEDQIDEDCINDDLVTIPEHAEVEKDTNDEEKAAQKSMPKDKTILIIEDNEDLLQLMTRLLSYDYNILTAQNGCEGLEIVENENVDLVVSDVMMPEMDGIEFCKAVKSNFDICHIPIILLTAKNKERDQIEGYDSGADGYLRKPFNLSVLHAKIKNLLKSKERTARDFKKQIVFEAQELDYTSIDEDFLRKAVECVHRHLEDVEFDQQQFIEEMNVSKSTLYRKLKSLTGLNTSSFIRNIRLKAACQLIEVTSNIRIAELAYAVGFNDPKYFSACFKKEFNMLPSEYIDRFTNNSSSELDS